MSSAPTGLGSGSDRGTIKSLAVTGEMSPRVKPRLTKQFRHQCRREVRSDGPIKTLFRVRRRW